MAEKIIYHKKEAIQFTFAVFSDQQLNCDYSMFEIQKISLVQFKNYSKRSFAFTNRIVGICGKNGVGKTNVLDAIHYLCFTKSYFSRMDSTNIQIGKTGFRIEGDFNIQGKSEKAVCILRETGKKEFSVDEKIYERFSHHIGRYPCVVIAPDDATLIIGGSEERRKFLDALLSQLDTDYLANLIAYNKILQQRNSLLKSFADSNKRDPELLQVLDEQLLKPGNFIYNKRKEFLLPFLPAVKKIYHLIAGETEEINLLYDTELSGSAFKELLLRNLEKDCLSQRTTSGVHRDEIELQLGKQSFKNIASQGQRKSLLFALKLAEMNVLNEEKGFPPLLLLDDIFEKLDEDRISNLLEMVCVQNKSQVFITDTNEERLTDHLEAHSLTYQIIKL